MVNAATLGGWEDQPAMTAISHVRRAFLCGSEIKVIIFYCANKQRHYALQLWLRGRDDKHNAEGRMETTTKCTEGQLSAEIWPKAGEKLANGYAGRTGKPNWNHLETTTATNSDVESLV